MGENFIKKTWINGDVITAEELNRMEDGIDENSDLIKEYLVSDNIIYSQPELVIGEAGDTNQKATFFTVDGPFTAGDVYTFVCDSIENAVASTILQANSMSDSDIIMKIDATTDPNDNDLSVTVTQQQIDNGLDRIIFSVNASDSTPLEDSCVITNPMIVKGDEVALQYTDEFEAIVSDIVEDTVRPPIEGMGGMLMQLGSDVEELQNDLGNITIAESSDVGKTLKVATVEDGKVTEWEFDGGGNKKDLNNYASSILRSCSGDGVVAISDVAPNTNLKQLFIDIFPEQEGFGDPSPDNPRPIKGWSSADIIISGSLIDFSQSTEKDSSNVSVSYQESNDYDTIVNIPTINIEGTNAYQIYKFYGFEIGKHYTFRMACNVDCNNGCKININQINKDAFRGDFEDSNVFHTFELTKGFNNYLTYEFTAQARFLYMTIIADENETSGSVTISFADVFSASGTGTSINASHYQVTWPDEYGVVYIGSLNVSEKIIEPTGGYKVIDPDVDEISITNAANENGCVVIVRISDMSASSITGESFEEIFKSNIFKNHSDDNSDVTKIPLYNFFYNRRSLGMSDNSLAFVLPSTISSSADAQQWFREHPTEITYFYNNYTEDDNFNVDVSDDINVVVSDILNTDFINVLVFSNIGKVSYVEYVADTKMAVFGTLRQIDGSNPIIDTEWNDGEYLYNCLIPIETITIPSMGGVRTCYDIQFTTGEDGASVISNGTIKWPDGFDLEHLDADTYYEINIMNGLALVMKWPTQ